MSVPSISIDARLRVERAVKKRNGGRFAGAGRADERDRFARQRLEVQIRRRHPLAVIGE